MTLICTAFAYQACSNKKHVQKTTVCCHDCTDYKHCLIRCENSPSICGKSEHKKPSDTPPSKHLGRIKARQVVKYNAETLEEIEVYPNVKTAASENGIKESTMYRALSKKSGLSNGFVWRYYHG